MTLKRWLKGLKYKNKFFVGWTYEGEEIKEHGLF